MHSIFNIAASFNATHHGDGPNEPWLLLALLFGTSGNERVEGDIFAELICLELPQGAKCNIARADVSGDACAVHSSPQPQHQARRFIQPVHLHGDLA